MREAHGSTARLAAGLCGLFAASVFIWLAIWAVAPMALGWRPMVITSDSMSPGIWAGDVVVARPHPGIGLGEGTVVAFEDPAGRGLTTHRIEAVNPDGTYTTRGDANRVADSIPIHPEHVMGVGELLVPLVGLPLLWLQSGAWTRFLLALGALISSLWLSQWAFEPAFPRPEPRGRDAPWMRKRREPTPARIGLLLGALLVMGALAAPHARAAFTDLTVNQGSSFEAWAYTYDAAVTDLRAPSPVAKNQPIDVEVDVENLGIYQETFDVELRDATKGKVIGTQQVTLAPGAATTVVFSSWKPGGPPGQRLLEAESRLASEENPSNDTMSTSVNVT